MAKPRAMSRTTPRLRASKISGMSLARDGPENQDAVLRGSGNGCIYLPAEQVQDLAERFECVSHMIMTGRLASLPASMSRFRIGDWGTPGHIGAEPTLEARMTSGFFLATSTASSGIIKFARVNSPPLPSVMPMVENSACEDPGLARGNHTPEHPKVRVPQVPPSTMVVTPRFTPTTSGLALLPIPHSVEVHIDQTWHHMAPGTAPPA